MTAGEQSEIAPRIEVINEISIVRRSMHNGLGSGTYANASFGTLTTTGNLSVDTVKLGINFLFH